MKTLRRYGWPIAAAWCTAMAGVFAEPIGVILGIWLVLALIREVKVEALLDRSQELNDDLIKTAWEGLRLRREVFNAENTPKLTYSAEKTP